MNPLIEVCVEGFLGAEIAINAGADRIELNSSLSLDGLTPTFDDCLATKRLSDVPVIAMLRPHADGFNYDAKSQAMIIRDLEELLHCGVDGVAFGALATDGEIDLSLMADIRKRIGGRTLVMHRAFDQLRNQATGLEHLIDLGVDRVLTSGGAITAEAGVEQLRQLVIQSRERIEILPGAGIRPSNALAILQHTGCNQLHGTFKQAIGGKTIPDPFAISQLKKLKTKP